MPGILLTNTFKNKKGGRLRPPFFAHFVVAQKSLLTAWITHSRQ